MVYKHMGAWRAHAKQVSARTWHHYLCTARGTMQEMLLYTSTPALSRFPMTIAPLAYLNRLEPSFMVTTTSWVAVKTLV